MKSQGKLLPPKLEKQMRGYRKSQLTETETFKLSVPVGMPEL